jgi:hypothetical protein
MSPNNNLPYLLRQGARPDGSMADWWAKGIAVIGSLLLQAADEIERLDAEMEAARNTVDFEGETYRVLSREGFMAEFIEELTPEIRRAREVWLVPVKVEL